MKQAVKYANQFEEALRPDSGVGLYLHGEPYTFKTFLATLVLRLLMTKNYDCRYWTLDTLMTAAKKAGDLTETLGEDHCIVIDNIGIPPSAESGQSWQRGFLKRVVRLRSDQGLPYLICSSLEPAKIIDYYAEDTYARFRNDLITVECSCTVTEEDLSRMIADKKKHLRLC